MHVEMIGYCIKIMCHYLKHFRADFMNNRLTNF